MARKLSAEEFILKAKEVHGGKYDYSNVVYRNTRTKVIIICPVHGDFLQSPNPHLQGQGCPKCANEENGDRCRLTKEQFIVKSRSIHGNKYDYSKVVYKSLRARVTLICKKHDKEFEQLAKSHLKGCVGCEDCLHELKGQHKSGYWAYERCYETAKRYEWLSEFTKQEGSCFNASRKNNWLKDFTWLKRNYDQDEDIITSKKHLIYKYELSQFNTVYVGLTVSLEKRHKNGHLREGPVYNFCKANYLDIPQPQIVEENLTLDEAKIREGYWVDYYKKQGYSLLNKAKAGSVGILCVVKTGKEADLFTRKAREVHGDKYNYFKVKYTNSQTKVTITCPVHGDFEQQPNCHIQGNGCPKCGIELSSDKRRRTREEFEEKAKQVHGEKYGYSKVKYASSDVKVTITCLTHGDFEQTPNAHLQGQGCPKCSGVYKPTTEEFIVKARSIHGNKYYYSKVEYINKETKVIIVCPTHGEFNQTAHNHLQGQGCPKCGKERRAEKRIKWTYETCKLESNKYKSRGGFQKGNSRAYDASRRNKWLDEFFPKK